MTSVMPKQEVEPMSPERLKTVMKKLVKARTALVLEHPFVGSIALNMPYEMDHTIPTAATNGKRIKFNPYFIEDLTDEEVKFLVAHECFHPMLEHPFRRGDRNHRKWNQAGDYVINQLLTDEGIGKMIDGGLINKSLFDAGKGTTDGIYNILPDEEGDDPLDDCEDGDGTPAEREQQSAEWKVKVAQAAQSAKMMGKMSAGLERLVDQVLSKAQHFVITTLILNLLIDQGSGLSHFKGAYLAVDVDITINLLLFGTVLRHPATQVQIAGSLATG